MVEKLFGTTKEEQLAYLKPRLTALLAALGCAAIGALLMLVGLKQVGVIIGGLGMMIFAVDMLVFGWAILRGLFGVASFGVLFSGNVVLGVVVFILYMTLGYFGGMIVAVIGLCRYLVLLKERKACGHGIP